MQPHRSSHAVHWTLDPEVVFLNHGSFGACPRPVLAYQQSLRDELELEPLRFLDERAMSLWAQVRAEVSEFVGADPEGLVFVRNATVGVNTGLAAFANFEMREGDEILVTDHEYRASRNAADWFAERCGARVVPFHVPFPLESEDEVVDAVFSAVTPRTRFALLDHITSQTGLVFPIERLVRGLRERGIETVVDGAHGPGMVPLRLDEIGAAFYTGNCHKWLCTPKGAGILYVREDWRERTRPLVISHGATAPRGDRSRLHAEFDWIGTDDPTAVLSIGESIRFLGGLLPGGWDELMSRNRELALESRRIICDALGVSIPAPESMIGTLAAIPLPAFDGPPPGPPTYVDPVQKELFDQHRIEVPIIPWPEWPSRIVRTSSQLYNHPSESEYLAETLRRRIG
ncbi:MAG: aminotransferase class V-fold PLP-dependent enzyme [Candidatus Eisenbacteria bacterium]|nr:aminotransferase class V-fold PLP-dependent enzyme [Candidatus Eisenbacteria bacterium]